MNGAREKHSFRLPAELMKQLEAAVRTRQVSRTAIVEAALAAYLSPDSPDRLEAVVTRRLDRQTRQLDHLAWHLGLSNETLALFIRFWLNNTVPLPDAAQPAAQAMGKERWERFVESLARRMETGPRLGGEISRDAAGPT